VPHQSSKQTVQYYTSAPGAYGMRQRYNAPCNPYSPADMLTTANANTLHPRCCTSSRLVYAVTACYCPTFSRITAASQQYSASVCNSITIQRAQAPPVNWHPRYDKPESGTLSSRPRSGCSQSAKLEVVMIVATSSTHTSTQAEDGNVQKPLGRNVAAPEDYTMHACMH
jgi:hypothetical protein